MELFRTPSENGALGTPGLVLNSDPGNQTPPDQSPGELNATGISSRFDTRLVVVRPVTFMILTPPMAASVLTAGGLTWGSRRPSILAERPVGHLSAAGFLYQTSVFESFASGVGGLNCDFHGRLWEELAAKGSGFRSSDWYYDCGQGGIRPVNWNANLVP